MASSSVCWGIEIGASAIKAIKMEAAGDEGVKVLEYAVIPHPKVLSTPGVDANDVIRVSLGALTSQHDLSKAGIAVSVPGHAGFARFAKLPPVEPKKVPDIVKFEAMQQIPFPLEQVEWDYQTFVSPDSPDVEVGIFAITRERVTERLNLLADVGINPGYVVLSPIAVYNALAYDLQFGNQTPGTIIVDVGTTSTDLVIATPGRMWVRTFPIGGHQFTEALVNQFQLSYPKAEKLKREAEDSRHARQVFQAMRPVFTDLAQDIQRSIGYYQSLNKDAQLTRLIGVGSTFGLPGLRKYLKQQLSLDVYRVEQFKRVKLEGAKEGDEKFAAFQEASLNLVTAYGLGLQGLGLNSVGGNLMPVSVLRKAMWKEKAPWFGMAAGVAVLAGGAMFVGPARDYFAVGGTVPDSIIQTSLSSATRLKNEATTAGVTASGEPDYKAANASALFDHKGMYKQIVADVGQMITTANERAATWASSLGQPPAPAGPAFAITKFDTAYEAPFTLHADFGQDESDPLKMAKHPRIRCVLTMTTSQPEARRFVNETVGRWLATNATRQGIAYTLKFNEPAFTLTETAAEIPAATGIIPGGELGAEREAIRRSNEEATRSGKRPMGGGPTGGFGESGYTQPAAGAEPGKDVQAAIDSVNKIAALTEPKEPPHSFATVTVTWWAAIIPPEPAPDAAGGAK